MPVEKQIVVLFAATNGYADGLRVDIVPTWEKDLLLYINSHYPRIYESIFTHKMITSETEHVMREAIQTFNRTWEKPGQVKKFDMSSIQELRFHIRSIKNISQVTGALETVSTSKVRRLVQAYKTAKPYAEKSWKVLLHLARQPGHTSLHPLLSERSKVNKVLVILITSDRGLAGAYNINLVRHVLQKFENYKNACFVYCDR